MYYFEFKSTSGIMPVFLDTLLPRAIALQGCVAAI